MESLIKKTEVDRSTVELTDTSSLSQINTIKVKYRPPTPIYYSNQISNQMHDAKIGLVFVIPPRLTEMVIHLFTDQLKITPDIQDGEFFLSASFQDRPRIFRLPLEGLKLLQAEKLITEQFKQKISEDYTQVLTDQLEKEDEINEKGCAQKTKKLKTEQTHNTPVFKSPLTTKSVPAKIYRFKSPLPVIMEEHGFRKKS